MKIESNLRGKSGVYQIVNTINSKSYVGSSVDIYNRLHVYPTLNKRQKVHNKHLQSAFNKYGIGSFKVHVIELLDISSLTKDIIRLKLRDMEQKWVNKINPEYNKRKTVDLNYQISPTKSTREKISETMKNSIKNGLHAIKRTQKHSVAVTLFDLDGNLIKRFTSCGLLAEYIGRKGQTLLRHAYCSGTSGHKCGSYLIYLTKDENKVIPYDLQKKQRYDSRNKRKKTK